jgi:hypothetical protein
VADADVAADPVSIEVMGGQDIAGNALEAAPPQSTFAVDTMNPKVLAVAASDEKIEDLDAGKQLTLTVQFSEAMDLDVDPAIALPSILASTLLPSGGAWKDESTYRAIYDIHDADALELGADIQVTGACDEAGNLQINCDELDVFDVEMKAPRTETIPAIQVIPAGSAGEDAFLDRCLDLKEGEEPPRIGCRALAAMYEIGESVSGGCILQDEEGRPLRASYVHVFIYTIDPTTRPEGIVLLDHWIAHYDTRFFGYCFAWNTMEQEPGYYDIYLAFPDGSGEVRRIQLVEPEDDGETTARSPER